MEGDYMRVGGEYMLIRGPENLQCEMHINPELEFVYLLEGSMTVLCDDGRLELKPGEFAMVLPYRLHQFLPAKDCKAWVLMFSYSISESFYNTYRMQYAQSVKCILEPPVAGYVESLVCRNAESLSVYEIRSLYNTMLGAYLRTKGDAVVSVDGSMVLRGLIEHIATHVLEEMTLRSVCAQFGLSEARVRRALKKVNMSFGDLVASIRISHALTLLANDDLNITEIAYECGFGSIRSFNRIFIKIMQCTPSEYRKEIR